METNNLLAPLFFVLIRLMGGAILKFGLKKMPLPYTVGLFAFGLLIGTFDRIGWLESIPILKSSIDFAGNANPDMILYIFLPILIFDAAYELDVHIFRKTLTNATILSVPGVIIAMLLTAALMIGIGTFAPSYEGWNWTFALMFGALISATDPVAIVALLKELGTSKRFSTLVDAESMLNDGTGIVLFMLFFGAYTATGVSDSPVADFIMVVAGGALVGTLLAYLCIQFITNVNGDEMLQNSVMILSAYMTFVIAQNYLEVSGVIALVGFGLTVSYMGRLRLKPQVNKFMRQFWELAAHIANTLIFIIVGVVIALKVDFSWMDLLILICVYAGINIIRILIITIFLSDHETVRIWLVGARVHDLELGRITWCIGTNDGTDGIVYLFDTRTNTSASTFPYGWDCNFNIDNKCDYNRLASKEIGIGRDTVLQASFGL